MCKYKFSSFHQKEQQQKTDGGLDSILERIVFARGGCSPELLMAFLFFAPLILIPLSLAARSAA